MKKYLNGIRFGMIVQLIIGPICLFVYETSTIYGFIKIIPLIIIVAGVDVFYITLACFGVEKLLKREKIKRFLKFFSSTLIIIFGLSTILDTLNIKLVADFSLYSECSNIYLEGLVLALSNPITIMFWSSVLTTKLLKDKYKGLELILFCFGLVSATILFLSVVSIVGSTISKFIPSIIQTIINCIIGIYLIYYGINNFLKKE